MEHRRDPGDGRASRTFVPALIDRGWAVVLHGAALLVAALPGWHAGASPAPRTRAIPPPRAPQADMLVGAYYFPGWSQEASWYCIAAHDQVLHPLLGYYREGDPDAADWHIKWAVEHGVSFFAFDYYTRAGTQMLEAALDEGFLRARYLDRFRFCLNWCNHAPASTMTAEELEHFGDLTIRKYLTHRSYLRLRGKPVVMILAGHGFVKNLGVEGARLAFERFDARCREAGLPGVHLVFCEGEVQRAEDVADSLAAGAQEFCLYNYPYAGTGVTGPGKHAEASYAHLVEQGEMLWKHWRGITDGRFWPTVMPGWDRRPWTREADLIRTGSTPALFENSLRRAREHANADRVVMIEAWNEWGEGSVLEPSREHGFAYLDRVRRVFCPKAGRHQDASPDRLGLPRPVFPLRLPTVDAWRFDRDTEGWTATGLTGLRQEWGALAAVSTSNDPQLTSPPTYLPCGRYPRAVVRMRARPVASGPPAATGQLFWSTTERGLSEEASATFAVPLDGAWHLHVLNLAAIPAWRGLTDRFRLDPVDVPGVQVEVDAMVLVAEGPAAHFPQRRRGPAAASPRSASPSRRRSSRALE